jgi:hypothetical protein
MHLSLKVIMFHLLISDTLIITQLLEFQLGLSDIQEHCRLDSYLLMMGVESSSGTFVPIKLHNITSQIIILVSVNRGSPSIKYSFPISKFNLRRWYIHVHPHMI